MSGLTFSRIAVLPLITRSVVTFHVFALLDVFFRILCTGVDMCSIENS